MGGSHAGRGPGRDRSHVWTAAAIAAELETGRREDTARAAQASLLVRTARIATGVVVSGLGVALLVLPGPGLVVLAVGLSILSQDVPFARRLLRAVRARMPEDADGGLPTWLLVLTAVGVVAGLATSAALMLL